MKITYPISTLPEHLHSTIRTIGWMEGCAALLKRQKLIGNSDTNTPMGLMPEPRPRSIARLSGHVSSQEGHNIHPLEG